MKHSRVLARVRNWRISAILETSLSPSSGTDMMTQLNNRGGFTAFISRESVKPYKKYIVIHKTHKCLVNTRRNIQSKKSLVQHSLLSVRTVSFAQSCSISSPPSCCCQSDLQLTKTYRIETWQSVEQTWYDGNWFGCATKRIGTVCIMWQIKQVIFKYES
jgi:hypothetical protein